MVSELNINEATAVEAVRFANQRALAELQNLHDLAMQDDNQAFLRILEDDKQEFLEGLKNLELSSIAAENEKDRNHTSSERRLDREHEVDIEQARFAWQSEERIATQTWQSLENQLGREFTTAERVATEQFMRGERPFYARVAVGRVGAGPPVHDQRARSGAKLAHRPSARPCSFSRPPSAKP